MSCGCGSITITTTGGVTAAGSAVVTTPYEIDFGGAACGGSASIDVVQDVYDGMEAIYPLDETGAGVADEYVDRSRHQLHGTGGATLPTLDGGVFCLSSQSFNEGSGAGSYIDLPQDTMPATQPFTVSCWVNIETKYKTRTFYSRGEVFAFGHGYLNHIIARYKVDGKTYQAFSGTKLEQNRWYHVACTVEPSAGITLFVNGVASSTLEVAESESLAVDSGGYVGRFIDGSYPTGNIQELRIYPNVRSAGWLAAERSNFCGGLFTVGSEEAAT